MKFGWNFEWELPTSSEFSNTLTTQRPCVLWSGGFEFWAQLDMKWPMIWCSFGMEHMATREAQWQSWMLRDGSHQHSHRESWNHMKSYKIIWSHYLQVTVLVHLKQFLPPLPDILWMHRPRWSALVTPAILTTNVVSQTKFGRIIPDHNRRKGLIKKEYQCQSY